MKIEHVMNTDVKTLSIIASMLNETFPHAYKTITQSYEEAKSLVEGRYILLVAKEKQKIIGVIGARAMYSHTGWELHPLIIVKQSRKQGVGTQLVEALEDALRSKGCVTLYLGTDDEFYQTTLSQTDLYDNPYKAMEEIKNLDNHPYVFYQKCGFMITGVIPDANGLNKPDIIMSKRMHMQKR